LPIANVIADWVRKNCFAIMTEVHRVAKSLGLSTKDVVLEIDLKKTSNPDIVVKPYRPDWDFCKNDRDLIAGLKDAHGRMTDKHILMVHRSYDTDFGVCRFQVA
jgi:hypothetical protein